MNARWPRPVCVSGGSSLTVPLVAHVVFRFDTGGLENGIVNLINRLPPGSYRHVVIALTEVAPAFSRRVRREDVRFIALHKSPGHAFNLFPRLWKLFRDLRPAIVHTRNLAALECQLPAMLAGVPVRIHGEHGRDVGDLDGSNKRHQWARRAYRPFVHHYIALSRDLAEYLQEKIGVQGPRITQVYNGVDTERFRPACGGREPIPGCPFPAETGWIFGSVGRMQPVKAQTLLARAFLRALELQPALGLRCRLVMVGNGPLRAEAQALLDAAGVGHLAWLPGDREDVPDVMRGLDAFVLPSLAEGISNTILEAMATGLPVLATHVGGNADLVVVGTTGELVEAGDVDALAQGLVSMAANARRARAMGAAGRALVEQSFGLLAMVNTYRNLYDQLLAEHIHPQQD